MEVYGDWLYERRELPQAAAGKKQSNSFCAGIRSHLSIIAFLEAGSTQKAMVTFEKNLQWRELFDLAFLNDTPEEELQDMAYRVSGKKSEWSIRSTFS
jgi:elongator complex protein 1